MSNTPIKKNCANCAYHFDYGRMSGRCVCGLKKIFVDKNHKCRRFKWETVAYTGVQERVNGEIIKRLERIEKKLDKIDFNVR